MAVLLEKMTGLISSRRGLCLLAYTLLLALFMLSGCKKKKKVARNIAEKERSCDGKGYRSTTESISAGELLDGFSGLKLSAKLAIAANEKAITVAPTKDDKSKVALKLGMMSAQVALSLPKLSVAQAIERLKKIKASALSAGLLQRQDANLLDSFLGAAKKQTNIAELLTYTGLVRAELLGKMRKPRYRYRSLLVLAGGTIFSYKHAAAVVASNPTAAKKANSLLNQPKAIEFLVHELGTCMADKAKGSKSAQVIVEGLKQIHNILKAQKPLSQDSYKMIAKYSNEALKQIL